MGGGGGALLMVFHRNYHCILHPSNGMFIFNPNPLKKEFISFPKEIKLSFAALEQWTDHSWNQVPRIEERMLGSYRKNPVCPAPKRTAFLWQHPQMPGSRGPSSMSRGKWVNQAHTASQDKDDAYTAHVPTVSLPSPGRYHGSIKALWDETRPHSPSQCLSGKLGKRRSKETSLGYVG